MRGGEVAPAHWVIVGNGGAGVSALEAVRSVDGRTRVTVISREESLAYSPCSLPSLISGEADGRKVVRVDRGFYERLNAGFLGGAEVVKVSTRKRQLVLADGKRIGYDRLLIAAGASPIVPKGLGGLSLKGVHLMGSLASALGIAEHAGKGARRALVVGAGFIGLETAAALRKRGLEVTVVELLPRVLARMLDPDMSIEVEKLLRARGVRLVLGDSLEDVIGSERVEGAVLGSGRRMKCDMLVLAIGVAPNLGMLKGSGIAVNRGILVDGRMRTNVRDVFAAGDIAEVRERVLNTPGSFAIWPNAVDQGRVAGLNMAGSEAAYRGADLLNVLDLFDVPIVTAGWASKDVRGSRAIVRRTPGAVKRGILKDGRLVGFQFFGTVGNAGPLYALVRNGEDVGALEDRLLDEGFVNAPSTAQPIQISKPGGKKRA